MQSISTEFWIGLALAIPLSILGNLITPKVLNFYSRFFEKLASKRAVELEAEADRVQSYINEPNKLYLYLLSTIIGVTMLGSIVGIFSNLFFIAASLTTRPYMNSLGHFFIIFGGILVAKLCVDALSIMGKVKARKSVRHDG
jgi:pilus assembly protein TadC